MKTLLLFSLIIGTSIFPQKMKVMGNSQAQIDKYGNTLSFDINQKGEETINEILEQQSLSSIEYGSISSTTETFYENSWIVSAKSFKTYDNFLLQKRATSYFDLPNSNYGGHYYSTYFYNNENKINERLDHYRFRYFYTYNSSGQLVEILIKWWSNIDLYRYTYSYDNNGFLVESLVESWNNNTWNNSSKALYTNNSSGNPVEVIAQSWTGSDWRNFRRYINTYDSNQNLIEKTRQNWNVSNNQWENFIRNSYTYNINNLLMVDIREWWENNSWNNQEKSEYFYDQNNIEIEIKGYSWNGMWEYYSHTVNTNSSEDAVEVLTPSNGQSFFPNSQVWVNWLSLGVDNVDISFSSDNGLSWNLVASNIPDTGNYDYHWTAPDSEYNEGKIKISSSTNPTLYAVNYGTFKIEVNYYKLTHTTNTVQFSVFNNGYLGDDGQNSGVGFKFNSLPNALYTGGIILATPSSGANGMIGSLWYSDFINVSPMKDFESNNNFDQISIAKIKDDLSPSPIGVDVTQQVSSRNSDNFIFIVYKIKNKTLSSIEELSVGVFLDWDIETYSTNLGGLDENNNLAYQFNTNASSDTNYYGIAALSGMSGARITSSGGTRFDIGSWISQIYNETLTVPTDYRSFIGSGPYNLQPNESIVVGFAILAGSNMEELQDETIEAQSLWNIGIVGVEEVYSDLPSYELLQNYPNPFNPATTIKYQIPELSFVTIKVYDVLGSEIVTLINEEKSAGSYKINFNATNLSSGVYFYRIQAGDYVETKKMILLR